MTLAGRPRLLLYTMTRSWWWEVSVLAENEIHYSIQKQEGIDVILGTNAPTRDREGSPTNGSRSFTQAGVGTLMVGLPLHVGCAGCVGCNGGGPVQRPAAGEVVPAGSILPGPAADHHDTSA